VSRGLQAATSQVKIGNFSLGGKIFWLKKWLNGETRKGTAGDFHQLTRFVVNAQNQHCKSTLNFIQCHVKNKT
jgi:hypothetical protein